MSLRTLSASLVIVATVACSSPKKEAYRRLAGEANPLLSALRPVAEKMLALKPEDRAAITGVCMAADEQLWLLRKINFDAEHVTPGVDRPVSIYARDLLDERSLMCKPENGDRYRIERCSNWCLETWTGMIKAVDRLRLAAKTEGVEIVSLRP